ncbi:ABC transporter ATP-binding protein [Pseudoflavonifractor sp. MSJ-37]|uniref:ABC transporter ATP-binding protein n=1 Tax=Pseudoflavonifractor sp. MSJ-37 TaxID=2841531 RepID=UPI001C128D20|nr:ABC transporter ATP-binding protein [Pseudoflavonifractor sp. MSJ-37]
MIEVRDLVKRYGGHTAVDHLSFTVPDGQIFGFLGPNGAGKSTTMNLMTGYLGPTEGDVSVDGHSIQKEPGRVKQSIGYLPEIPPLYPDMGVEEYLAFAAELKKVPKRERRDQTDQVMEMTGLFPVRERLIRNLSKGYKQRVGLAQALLGSPKVLILDEPTVGLDPKQIIEIRSLIRSLAKDHTVILSSHILSEIQEMCDHLLIIHHGRKVAAGSPAELERELAGDSSLEVTVKGDAAKALSLLGALPGVMSVEARPCPEEGAAAFRLKQSPDCDARESLFQACAGAGLPILELRRDRMTLEDIFLRLTSDDALSPAPADDGPDTENPGGSPKAAPSDGPREEDED